MKTTTEKMAEALRRAMNESSDVPAGLDPNGSAWWSKAFRALREYDARPRTPDQAALRDAERRFEQALEDLRAMGCEPHGFAEPIEYGDNGTGHEPE